MDKVLIDRELLQKVLNFMTGRPQLYGEIHPLVAGIVQSVNEHDSKKSLGMKAVPKSVK